MSQQLELQFEKEFTTWKINVYITIATTILIIYDYILMLPAEIQQIWLRPKSLRTIVFISLRYTILLGQFIQMIVQFIPWNELLKAGEITCNVTWRASAILQTMFILSFTASASFRIYAVSTDYKLLKAGTVLVIGTISAASDAYVANLWTVEPLVSPFSGCVLKLPSPAGTNLKTSSLPLARVRVLSYIGLGFSLFAELLVQIYTWQSTYKIMRDLHVNNTYRPLFTLIFRDGTLVYLTTIASSILVCATFNFVNLLPISLAVASILMCRWALQFREILNPLISAPRQNFSSDKSAQTQLLDTTVFLLDLTIAEDDCHCEEYAGTLDSDCSSVVFAGTEEGSV